MYIHASFSFQMSAEWTHKLELNKTHYTDNINSLTARCQGVEIATFITW